MPLDSYNGEGSVHDAFDYAVPGAAYREQVVSQMIDSLVVGGVYKGALAVELVKEILTTQTAVIDMVELIASGPFVAACGDDVLIQIASEVNIDHLESLADAKHGFDSFDKAGKRFEL